MAGYPENSEHSRTHTEPTGADGLSGEGLEGDFRVDEGRGDSARPAAVAPPLPGRGRAAQLRSWLNDASQTVDRLNVAVSGAVSGAASNFARPDAAKPDSAKSDPARELEEAFLSAAPAADAGESAKDSPAHISQGDADIQESPEKTSKIATASARQAWWAAGRVARAAGPGLQSLGRTFRAGNSGEDERESVEQAPVERAPLRTPQDLAALSWKQRSSRHDPALKEIIETGRSRLLLLLFLFGIAYMAIAVRLVEVTVIDRDHARRSYASHQVGDTVTRAEIVDRNGELLATSLETASLFANPRKVLDPRGAAMALKTVLPDLDMGETLERLSSGRSFVWIKRNLTPRQHADVLGLGLPGLDFRNESRRFYPQGHVAAHVLGYTDIDNRGLAGIEKTFDRELGEMNTPLALSLDVRVQHIMREELARSMEKFKAKGGAGVVMDVTSGEVLALVSLPDFDPNKLNHASRDALFNRATLGQYEMGSTFKIFSLAMALDRGTVDIQGGYDASQPIRIANFTINDFHGRRRWLSVPEIFKFSSNIGTAKMVLDVGIEAQREYLRRFGLLTPSTIELPEVGTPLYPEPWRQVNSMTISYGHGIAVSPVQLVNAVAAIVNGGVMVPGTALRRDYHGYTGNVHRVISQQASDDVRRLLRLSVVEGTGRKADVPGYLVGGKTGTAEKNSAGGGYDEKRLLSSFVAVYPMHLPRYVVFAMLDEPEGIPETHGYATGAWVAAPVVQAVIARTSPLLGVDRVDEQAPDILRDLAIPPPRKDRSKTAVSGTTLIRPADPDKALRGANFRLDDTEEGLQNAVLD